MEKLKLSSCLHLLKPQTDHSWKDAGDLFITVIFSVKYASDLSDFGKWCQLLKNHISLLKFIKHLLRHICTHFAASLFMRVLQTSVLWMVWPMRLTRPSPKSTMRDTRWTAPALDRAADAGSAMLSVGLSLCASIPWTYRYINLM